MRWTKRSGSGGALDSVLVAVNQAITEGGDVERWLDHAIDSRTGEVLQSIRDAFQDHDAELDPQERPVFFKITNLCERFFWLQSHLPIDRLARIDGAQRPDRDPAPAGPES